MFNDHSSFDFELNLDENVCIKAHSTIIAVRCPALYCLSLKFEENSKKYEVQQQMIEKILEFKEAVPLLIEYLYLEKTKTNNDLRSVTFLKKKKILNLIFILFYFFS